MTVVYLKYSCSITVVQLQYMAAGINIFPKMTYFDHMATLVYYLVVTEAEERHFNINQHYNEHNINCARRV